ncbi:hypothetical protein L915_15763, partial [Phytophthora nicotianae]
RLCDNGPSHHPHFQMVNTPHLTFGVAVAEEATTMEEELKRWALHDCSAFRDTLVPDEMKRLFERFRATRGKHVMVTPTETIRSLDRAWTTFVKRWNRKGREAFESML